MSPTDEERVVRELLPPGGTILAETGQDPSDAAVRAVAVRIARPSGSHIILYDRSSATWGSDPFPSGPYTAQVEGPHGERPLRGEELPALGRAYLRDQIAEVEREGIGAQGWLARRHGLSSIVDAVDRVAPHLVLLNDDARSRGWLRWLGSAYPRQYVARIDAPLAAVRPDGTIRVLNSLRVDPSRSRLRFLADVPLRPIRGTFRRFDARVQLDPDSEAGGVVEAVIDASSVETGRAPRDLHLRSRAFLDAGRSPRMTFRSSSIRRDGDKVTIEGALTIRGQARPVTLWGTVHELSGWDDGRRRLRVQASTELRWRAWGIQGIPLVSDRLAIALDIVGVEVRPGSGRFNVRSSGDAPGPATEATRGGRAPARLSV